MPKLEQAERIAGEKKHPKADLIEIFSSHQGEGLFLGAKQIFIRFAGCNLDCSFCDTPKDAAQKGVTVEEILKKVNDLQKKCGAHHSISLTGGEPLLHIDFLEYLLPKLKKQNFKIYLETNGTLAEELKRIIGYINIIAMDVKLPSSTDMPPLWKKHIDFLKIARKRNLFIKAVITDNTSEKDILKLRDILKDFDKEALLILQPASGHKKGEFLIKKEKAIKFRELSEEKLKYVRIIPQVHKFMGIR